MRHSWSGAAACLLLAAVACTESSAPTPRPGAVVVTAYVDRDASGTFTAGDSALAGYAVDVRRQGGTVVQSGQTQQDGQLVVAPLAPGSYVVAPTGAAPDGSVLTTNAQPSVTITNAGDTIAVAFRYVFFPGSIAGRVYKDVDASGSFTEGDAAGAGLKVVLFTDSSGVPGHAIDSTVTDAEGAYAFARVAAGSYFLQFQHQGTMSYGEEGDTRAVTVAPSAPAAFDVTFTGSGILAIADVRTFPTGTGVSVRGYVTVPPGRFATGTGFANSEVWIQDATGGIAVFPVPTGDSTVLHLGDYVEVSGTTSAFGAQKQIGAATYTLLGGNAVVAPIVEAGSEVVALVNEGELISVKDLAVVSIGTANATGAFTVIGTTPTGESIQIRIVSSYTGLTRSSFTVGTHYDVTGVLSQFNGTAQLKPRFESDVAATGTVAAARAAAPGDSVFFRGYITVPPNVFTSGSGGVNSEIWVQDATGGIAVFSVPSNSTYTLGEHVSVSGVRGAFNGQEQVAKSATIALVVTSLGDAPLVVAPVVQTGAEMNALTLEGQLVTVHGITVTSIGTASSAGAFSVTGTTPDGQTVVVRVAGAATGVTPATFTVGSTYGVTGVLTEFNGTAQLKLRFSSDVVVE